MFCPTINAECVGKEKECRDWDAKEGKCRQSLIYEYYRLQTEQSERLLKNYSQFVEATKFEMLGTKMVLTDALKDPTIPEDAKKLIQQALQATSADVAERLIREAGLIE